MNHKQRRGVYILIVILILLCLANMLIAVKVVRDGNDKLNSSLTKLEYNLKSYTDASVSSALSKVEIVQGQPGNNGKDGVNGIQGAQGVQGIAGNDGLQGNPGKDGTNGQQGAQGEPGNPGREVELRHDPKTGSLQWRYVGDDLWTVLAKDCELNSTCKEE